MLRPTTAVDDVQCAVRRVQLNPVEQSRCPEVVVRTGDCLRIRVRQHPRRIDRQPRARGQMKRTFVERKVAGANEGVHSEPERRRGRTLVRGRMRDGQPVGTDLIGDCQLQRIRPTLVQSDVHRQFDALVGVVHEAPIATTDEPVARVPQRRFGDLELMLDAVEHEVPVANSIGPRRENQSGRQGWLRSECPGLGQRALTVRSFVVEKPQPGTGRGDLGSIAATTDLEPSPTRAVRRSHTYQFPPRATG